VAEYSQSGRAPLLVLTLDNTLQAIDRSDGSLMFRYRFARPLISSESYVDPSRTGAGKSTKVYPRLVPALDGSLYYSKDNLYYTEFDKIKIADVVSAAPL
jgi:hypothetical protein